MKLENDYQYEIIPEIPDDLSDFKHAFDGTRIKWLKYYENDEVRTDNIDDVLEFLNQTITEYESELKRLSNLAHDSYISQSVMTPRRIKAEIKRLEKLYDEILDENHIYYAVFYRRYNRIEIVPIKTAFLKAYKPVFNRKTCRFDIIFDEQLMKVMIVDDMIFTPDDCEKWTAHDYLWCNSVENIERAFYTDAKLLSIWVNVPDGENNWQLCKDCGKPFRVTAFEAEWFKNYNMSIPKRCLHCREIKKNSRKGDQHDIRNNCKDS